VLDDGLLASLDETRLQRVMAPKARGAWLLHRYSQALPLDFYVLFSSVSSLIGNAGQGNYVAANAFLDALAHYRHARGLPATSINWGAIAEVGMVGKDSGLEEHLARVGIHAIAPKNATAALAVAMKTDAAQIGFVDVDWAKLRQFNPAAASPKFSHVVSKEGATDNSATSQIRAALLAAEPKDRPELLALIMAELVAEAMRLPSDRIDIHQPLTEMGIDSLMAVELQMGIHESFGIEFPVLELVKGESILALAQQLLSRMDVATDVQEGQGDPVAPGAAAAA
jgi:acyl carrier protein